MAENYNSRWTGEQIDNAVALAQQGSIINAAEATTLAAGSPATAKVEGNVLKIGVPQGPTGPAYTLNDADKNAIADAVRSTMTAADVKAGTFAGQVVAKSDAQTPGTSLLRNSKLASADTNPTVNGEICWTYK